MSKFERPGNLLLNAPLISLQVAINFSLLAQESANFGCIEQSSSNLEHEIYRPCSHPPSHTLGFRKSTKGFE